MNPLSLLDRTELYEWLKCEGADRFVSKVKKLCDERYTSDYHGLYSQWSAAYEALPGPQQGTLELSRGLVEVVGELGTTESTHLRKTLMEFHPWRKGPFRFFGIDIDTEWRSDWKWNRLRDRIDLRGKAVLDVGSGNGYYGWRMLADGARYVLGCEPLQLYNFQFEVFRRYWRGPEQHFVVPLMDTDLPDQLQLFDVTFSMGVLYHRTSPIDHLKSLHSTLKPNGQVVVETLVVCDEKPIVLVPQDRYAKMRNVWFIPSIPMLKLWMERCGFDGIEEIDVSPTTTDEQRKTEWMTYESLPAFLDPFDSSKTFEGYPAPVRAIMTARKSR